MFPGFGSGYSVVCGKVGRTGDLRHGLSVSVFSDGEAMTRWSRANGRERRDIRTIGRD